MPTADQFEEMICAFPYDMGFRMVYADWLDEQKDPRGEFIRIQMELSKRPYAQWLPDLELFSKDHMNSLRILYASYGSKDEGEVVRLMARGRLLYNPSWLGALLGKLVDVQTQNWQYVWNRGFVEIIHCPSHGWLAFGPELVRSHPILCVHLTDNPDRVLKFYPNPLTWARGGHPDMMLRPLPILDSHP